MVQTNQNFIVVLKKTNQIFIQLFSIVLISTLFISNPQLTILALDNEIAKEQVKKVETDKTLSTNSAIKKVIKQDVATACTANGTTVLDHSGDPACAGKVQYRVIYKSIDCITNTADFEVQVKSDTAFPQPVMGDYNIRINYDATTMTRIGVGNGSLVTQNRYSTTAPSSNTDYGSQNLNGSQQNATTGILSINGFFSNIPGDLIPTTFITVSTIRMNIVNPAAPLNMDMNDATSFPTTGNNVAFDDGLGGYDLIEPAYETANIDLVGSTKNLLCAAPTITAVDDSYTTTGVSPVTLTPLTGDTAGTTIKSINGVLLTPGVLQNITTPNGIVTISASGVIKFTPTAGFTGDEIFPYVIQNLASNTATANEKVTVSAAALPIAKDDVYTTYNTPTTSGTKFINPISGNGGWLSVGGTPTPTAGKDTTSNGPIKLVSINGVTITNSQFNPGPIQIIPIPNGTIEVSAQGDYINFKSNIGYTGTTTFPYVIKDATGGTASANEIITVINAPCGTQRLTLADWYTASYTGNGESSTFNIDGPFVQSNSLTPPPASQFVGAPLISSLVGGVDNALTAGYPIANTIVWVQTSELFNGNAITSYIGFIPNADASIGNYFVANYYTINNGSLLVGDYFGGSISAISHDTYSIRLPLACPVATDDNYTTTGTTPVTLIPLTGDTAGTTIKSINGVDITPGTAQSIPVLNGTVIIDAADVIKFIPNAGYTGLAQFPYVIQNESGSIATANESIVVVAPTSQVCTNKIINGAFASDLSSWTTSGGWIYNNGTAALATDNLTNQTINQTISGYTVNNGKVLFKIQLQPAEANNLTTFGATMDISFGGVKYLTIVNPVGIGEVVYTAANGSQYTVDTTTRNQLVTIYLSVPAIGTAAQFEFKHVSDDDDWYIYNVENLACTTPIAAIDDNYTTTGVTPVTLIPLTGDTAGTTIKSISGTNLTPGTAQSISVTNGTVNIDTAGVIKFTPNSGFIGDTTFPYVIQDVNGQTATANVSITVSASVNLPPVATNDNYTTSMGTPKVITPLTGDTDPEGNILTVIRIGTSVIVPGVAQIGIIVPNGTVDVSATGVIKFNPVLGFVGISTFPYTISDGKGATATATQNISIINAFDDIRNTPVGIAVTYNPLTNDIVPIGSTITKINGVTPVVAIPITVPGGTVTLNGDGTITVTPTLGSLTPIRFPYEVTTPDGAKTTANEIITPELQVADVSILKLGDKVKTANGDTLSYIIKVKNNSGTISVPNATVVDALPAGYSVNTINCTTSAPSICPTAITSSQLNSGLVIPNIAANGEITITIVGTVTTTAQLVNRSEVKLPAGFIDPSPENNISEFPTVFDPPSGKKIGTYLGNDIVEWKQVWINEKGKAATNATIIDNIPAGTKYVPNTLQCFARGSSSTTKCEYNTANDSTSWQGTIGADFDHFTEETANNEIVITFQILLPANVDSVENQSEACNDRGCSKSDNPSTRENGDITKVTRPKGLNALIRTGGQVLSQNLELVVATGMLILGGTFASLQFINKKKQR